MALKFTDKLKNIEFPKVSVKELFNKDADKTDIKEEDIDTVNLKSAEELASKTQELQEKISKFFTDNSDKLKQMDLL